MVNLKTGARKADDILKSMEVVLDKYRRAVEPREFSQLGIGYTNI